jgi:hypothetical protein
MIEKVRYISSEALLTIGREFFILTIHKDTSAKPKATYET